MISKRNFRMVLIGIGFLMASVIAPIVVVVFETHYQQWLEGESSEPETVSPTSEPNQVSSFQPEIPHNPKPETVSAPESNPISASQPETQQNPEPETVSPPKPNPVSTFQPETRKPQKPETVSLPEPNPMPKPLIVRLWLDSPNKTQFQAGEKVTFYYQIDSKNRVPTKAYFNLAYKRAIKKWTIAINNEMIETGKLYSLPKTSAGSPLSLPAGKQHAIAIVTPTPIQWKALGADILAGLRSITILGTKELIVEVK